MLSSLSQNLKIDREGIDEDAEHESNGRNAQDEFAHIRSLRSAATSNLL
jgi:hypothetical protein